MANKKNTKASSQSTSFVDAAKERLTTFNKFVLETTEEVVDMGIRRAGQWQEIADKAVKGGLKVSAKQQDLVFEALESAKGQIIRGKEKVAELAK